MEKFKTFTGVAAFMPLANIDTDMIIPKRYLKTIKRSGLGRWLFAEMRYDAAGKPRADFVLNNVPNAQVLLAGENFGCGSSREHAPWSLMDFGLRVIIAPSFADIFYNNSFKNGLLPLKLDEAAITQIAQSGADVTINLETQTVSCAGKTYKFDIEPNYKTVLLEGLDPIAEVLQEKDAIKAFEDQRLATYPWLKKTGCA